MSKKLEDMDSAFVRGHADETPRAFAQFVPYHCNLVVWRGKYFRLEDRTSGLQHASAYSNRYVERLQEASRKNPEAKVSLRLGTSDADKGLSVQGSPEAIARLRQILTVYQDARKAP